jgi:hypothetical protein
MTATGPQARRLPLDQVEAPELRRVVAIWEKARGDRAMPRRADVLPEDFGDALGWVNLIEVWDTPPRYRFRLTGTLIAEVHGRDYTNRTSDDIEPPVYRAMVIATYDEAVAAAAPVAHGIFWAKPHGDLTYVKVSVPFSEDGVRVNMLMTCTTVNYKWRDALRGP